MTSIKLERWITRKLRLKHFELIGEVYDARSILKASRRLSLTQPAVTKAVRDVETALDLRLFERTNRGLEPTAYGEIVARHAKILLTELRHTAEELENVRAGYSGHVAVGTLLAASANLLPSAIALLKKERPGVAITVIEGTYDLLMPSLLASDIDMVLGRLPVEGRRGGLAYEELYAEATCLVVRARHPLVARKPLELIDLVNEAWLLPLPETTLRRQVEKTFIDNKAPFPRNIIESMSMLTNRALLQRSDCIGVMPYHVALGDVEHGVLAILPVNLSSIQSSVGVITRSPNNQAPAANALLKCLREVGQELSEHVA